MSNESERAVPNQPRARADQAPKISRARASRFALLALALPLGACSTVDRAVVDAKLPEDYRARHPIVLADAPVSVDIFALGGKLDPAMRARVEGLASEAKAVAAGPIEVLFPQGAVNEHQQRAALPSIRAALAAGGATGYLSVGAYPVADPSLPAPVRLSYRTVRARVASRCGEWPADLASGSSREGWNNRPYWNYGCSYQNMLAAQTSDPRDLVEPRAQTNGDVEMRMRAIGKVRAGSDPGTTWSTKNSSIGTVGGG